jgi:hypothetical protein
MWLCGVRIELDRTVERGIETNLGETDVGGLLTEALSTTDNREFAITTTTIHSHCKSTILTPSFNLQYR